MNIQSNKYTVIYSIILVIVAAVALSVTHLSLQSKQELNKEMEKKQMLLASIGINCTRDEAVNLYPKYVKDCYAIDINGNRLEGVDAFKIDLKLENLKPADKRQYPVYEIQKDTEKLYIFPVYGKGLWGPIWGYVTLKNDFNTISGVIFDHEGETPGLGANITTKEFQSKFINKKIFDDAHKFVSILVLKPGKSDPNNPHEIDGISGATLTSKGLEAMLYNSLIAYQNFFNKKTTITN